MRIVRKVAASFKGTGDPSHTAETRPNTTAADMANWTQAVSFPALGPRRGKFVFYKGREFSSAYWEPHLSVTQT